MNKLVRCSDEVANALQKKLPVVALESTIVAHGMPWPQNAETAFRVEDTVRSAGAVPATIALLDGKICVGLNKEEINRIAEEGSQVIKCSRRDIAYVLDRKITGATTVAATIIASALAGVSVFATGGIGGVHRGADRSFDISADLQELARNPVTVISAGAKSILDLPSTLEYLETLGVPVVGYRTSEFPAFYSRQSGLKVDFRLDSPQEVASLIQKQIQLQYPGGILVANPVPENEAAQFSVVEKATSAALEEARVKQIKGKAITPFLLARIAELTAGESLRANIALVLHNARLGAEIALALQKIS